jgi:hypothetical protein
VLIVFWADLWTRWNGVFDLGWLIPVVFAVMLAFLAAALLGVRWVRSR